METLTAKEFRSFQVRVLREFSKINGKIDAHDNILTSHTNLLFKLEQKIDALDERTKTYPKLYENVDRLISEIIENRQERTFLSNRLDRHDARLKLLEGS